MTLLKTLRLHRIIPSLRRRLSIEANINIIVLGQLRQIGHDIVADESMTLFTAFADLALFLERGDGVGGVGQALEDVDEDGVGFGDVEADVGDAV